MKNKIIFNQVSLKLTKGVSQLWRSIEKNFK